MLLELVALADIGLDVKLVGVFLNVTENTAEVSVQFRDTALLLITIPPERRAKT